MSGIRVYYNSACPVCKAGIENQKKKMPRCGVEWKDVHADNSLANEIDSELESIRERLHVVDEQGNRHIGFDAFIEIWRNSPDEKWKARISSLPVIRHTGWLAYNLFAYALYKWNRTRNHW